MSPLGYKGSMDQKDLGTRKISRLVPEMAFPLIVAQLVNGLYNLVDRIYLGHIEGSGATILTGVGITYPIILLITAFSSLIGNGGGPLSAIRMGQGRRDKAEEILSVSAASLLLLSVFLMAFFYAFMTPILYLFGASSETFRYGKEYMDIYLLGTPFVLLTLGLNPFISAEGKTVMSMMTVIIGAVMNIILDPIFIFAFGLGARGAAIATVISQFASAVYVVSFLRSRKSELRLRIKDMRIRKKVILPVISLGVSPFIMSATEAAITFTFTSRLQIISGDMAVGAMTIMSSVLNFCMMPINGMNQAVTPLVSYNFGAGHSDRVRAIFRFAAITEVSYTTMISLICNLIPGTVIGLFTSSEELISFASPYMKFYITGLSLFGLQCASQNTFMGLGQARISLFFAVYRKIILLIPLVYILSSTALGTTGVFLAESIADSVSALTTFTTFMLVHKKILAKGPSKPE